METWHSEELIREFHRSLVGEGMSAPAAARHRDRLRFFLHAYLAEEWPRELHKVDGEILRDFLGSWFLRQVGGSKSDLTTYLATFRRFFEHLYQNGRVSAGEFDDVAAVCSSRDFFLACHDEYFNPVPDAWEDFAAGRPSVDGLSMVTPAGAPIIDRQLWMLTRNLDKPAAPVILDFLLFLDYLANTSVKLTRAQGRLPLVHARRINQRFNRPEELPVGGRRARSIRINWFFELARGLKLIEAGEKNLVEVLPRLNAFLDLDSDTQLAIVIDASWNLVPWHELGAAEARRVSEWAQEHRDGFSALLAELSPHRVLKLDPDPGMDREDTLLARYILFHEVVENTVVFALGECGILAYTPGSDDWGQGLNLKSISITRFGRQVMRLYARRGNGGAPAQTSPVEALEQNLLFS